jgi:hypothetical protein
MMDISVFRAGKFLLNSNTKLICPDCNTGHLISKEKNIKKIEYKKYNNEIFALDDFESEWLRYGFFGFLQCDNKYCNEKIAVAGKLKINSGCYESQYILMNILR